MSTTTVEEPGAGHDASPARDAEPSDDARLVEAARAGDDTAFGRLYDRWFNPVYDVCRRIVHDPEVARETTQDAFLAAWRGLDGLRELGSFGGWLLRIARNKSLNRWEHERRSSSVDDMTTVLAVAPTTGPAGFSAEDRAVSVGDPAQVAADAELVALIEDAAAALGERDASVLDLHLRHGLEPHELAEELGVSHSAAKQVVHRLRGRLGDAIKSRVLWHAGVPACDELRALEADGIVIFDAAAARVIKRHAAGCTGCTERQKSRLSSAALFGAVPIGIAPVLLKQQTALAMEGEGVPMGGSQGTGTGAGTGSVGARLARRVARVGLPGGIVAIVAVTAVVLAAATVGEPKGSVDESGADPATPVSGPAIVDDASTPGPVTESDPPASLPGAPKPKPGSSPAPGQLPSGPAAVPAPAPPPAPPAIVSFGMAPGTAGTTYTMPGPVLSWSVSAGAGSVAVSGPPGLASSAFSGSEAVCPGTLTSGRCSTPSGVYSYTLTVFDQGGAVVDQRTVTLSIR